MIGVEIWAKIWDILLPCKKGAAWVECLWIFYEFSWGPHGWYRIGGRLLRRFSSISSGVKKYN